LVPPGFGGGPSHPFYKKLNEVLEKAGFDEFCEARCGKFYHEKLGRPSLAPGMYFRVTLIGFFEGIESERGIAWRVGGFVVFAAVFADRAGRRTQDHVTISRTRRLLDEATHQEVFGWVLRQVARAGLLKGKTIGIDATTLEANAAMKSIVRHDTEENYTEYLKGLAEAAGVEANDEAPLRRMDRRRSASGMAVIALRAWAKESLIVAITFALSLMDFSSPFMSIPGGGGVPTSL
jgi:transposase